MALVIVQVIVERGTADPWRQSAVPLGWSVVTAILAVVIAVLERVTAVPEKKAVALEKWPVALEKGVVELGQAIAALEKATVALERGIYPWIAQPFSAIPRRRRASGTDARIYGSSIREWNLEPGLRVNNGVLSPQNTSREALEAERRRSTRTTWGRGVSTRSRAENSSSYNRSTLMTLYAASGLLVGSQ